ncbi:TPA: glycosyltransferase [Candidatus Bathyarchaeota archaeon]|nr:glycosyltransferase [Candidatus Bathyarchaeota archaeon]
MINICYIMSLSTAMEGFFFDGDNRVFGMPAFAHVFFKLLSDKKFNHIYVLLFINREKFRRDSFDISVPKPFRRKIMVKPFIIRNKMHLFLMLPLCICYGMFLIKKHNIDILYGHGSIGALAGILSLLSRTPNIRRLYGTFLYKEANKSKCHIFIRHPLEYLAFALPSKSVIITNDGTHGDLVYKKIGNKRAKLVFLLNGIDAEIEKKVKPVKFALSPQYLSYVARIDYWKRQHLAIEALAILDKKGLGIPLYIVGPVINGEYFIRIKKLVKRYNIEHLVHFTGAIPREEALYVLKTSYLTMSLYDTSNLGNVFLESLRMGTPIVALNNNGSLDIFPEDAYCAIKSDNAAEVAKAIEQLLLDKNRRHTISKKAKLYAQNLISWRDRANVEIKLLMEGANIA